MKHSLSMLDFASQLYFNASLKNVRLICCQHLMESTFKMLCALREKGLEFSDISVLGKCYSSNLSVIREMSSKGIDVSPLSTFYNAHLPFDKSYKKCVKSFFHQSIQRKSLERYKKIIFLDDGGYLLEEVANFFEDFERIVGIEQTSSGYEYLKNKNLAFPIINIARSNTKLEIESPIIAQCVIGQLTNKLSKLKITPRKLLILGNGAVGKAIYERICHEYQIDIFDIHPSRSTLSYEEFLQRLKDYDLLIGSTGKISFPYHHHSLLKNGVVLASVSSSDREFDAVHLRKNVSSHNCHSDLNINGIILLNSGFPINFFGTRNNIPLKFIQITLSLLSSAILEASSISKTDTPKIRNLDYEIERELRLKFMQIMKEESQQNPVTNTDHVSHSISRQ